MTWELARPAALLLLLLLPVYAVWLRRRGFLSLPVPRTVGALQSLSSRRIRYLAAAPYLLRALTFAVLVVALAGPRTASASAGRRAEGIPIVLAIDISSSMLAEDFRPRNRLQVARETAARFIAGREDDPIGLVAFAGEAITQVPLTHDHAVLFGALDNLQIGLLEDGTAIGTGLATAVNRLRRTEGSSKVVILTSDGENNRGAVEPLEAARAAEAYGIQVFTIGIGSEGRARVPIRGRAGTEYAELTAGLDEDLLRRIAEVTGGRYFRATNPEALRRIYADIDQLVKTPAPPRGRIQYTDRYLPLVLAGAALLLLEWLLRGSRWGAVP